MTFWEDIVNWLNVNLVDLIVIFVIIILSVIILRIIKHQLNKLPQQKKLDEGVVKNIQKVIKFIVVLINIIVIFSLFSEALALTTTMLTLVGGTILGFAAINTIGNLIAGLIIMTVKPLSVGHRIRFNERVADVIEINLIYTTLKDLDERKIHVPNQKLLTEPIITLGKADLSRRHIDVTLGFDIDRMLAEKALLEAAATVKEVLEDPAPYVWITEFMDYAVKYTLFVYIVDIKHFPRIESDVYKALIDSCNKYNLEIAVPLMGNFNIQNKNE